MKTWTESHCKSHAHCLACRNDANFRASILKAGMVETRDFDCPEGAEIGQKENLPKPCTALAKAEPNYDRATWPLWARTAAAGAVEGDKGVGDVIARVVGPIGGDVFKDWFKKLTGKSCGCPERQEALNHKYPFKI